MCVNISGQFASVFPTQESNVFNPFNTNLTWANGYSSNLTNGGQPYANPFRTNEPAKANGLSYSFQPAVVPTMNGSAWSANPFKVTVALIVDH